MQQREDREDGNRAELLVRRDRGPQAAEKRCGGDAGVGRGRRICHPVGPADDEADARTKRAACIHVEAARRWHHRGQLRDCHGPEQRVDAAEGPGEGDQRRIAKCGGDRPRQAQDADADGPTKGHCESKANAENASHRLRAGGVSCHCCYRPRVRQQTAYDCRLAATAIRRQAQPRRVNGRAGRVGGRAACARIFRAGTPRPMTARPRQLAGASRRGCETASRSRQPSRSPPSGSAAVGCR